MVIRVQPDAGHPIILLAAPQVFLPVGEFGVNCSKRHEEIFAVSAALGRESSIYTAHVLMKNAVEIPCPHLRDATLAQSSNQLWSLVSHQPPEGPAREADVRVNNHTL